MINMKNIFVVKNSMLPIAAFEDENDAQEFILALAEEDIYCSFVRGTNYFGDTYDYWMKESLVHHGYFLTITTVPYITKEAYLYEC